MLDYLICGGQLITSGGTVPNTGILITRGKIAAPGAPGPGDFFAGICCSIGRSQKGSSRHGPARRPSGKSCCSSEPCSNKCVKINAEGLYISPGFIDLHLHGGSGHDTLDGQDAAIEKIAEFHARGGTTSFLAAVAPAHEDRMEKALSVINALTMNIEGGAQLLGAHLEGPCLNPSRAGAIDPDCLRDMDIKKMRELVAFCEGSLKMVTVAPELPGCTGLIKMLAQEDILVAAGHSEATYETAVSSFNAGVRHAIHLFNASAPLHHREPGLVGAVLAQKEVSAEVIADGHHLHPSMLRLLYSIKGSRGLTLATDAVSASGMPNGEYNFCSHKIIREGTRVTLPGGPLAGSTLTMIEAVRNMVNMAQVPIHEAVRMASLNPARLIGREARKGTLAPGMDADILLLDKDLNVRLTMVGGEIVYSSLDAG